MDITTAAKYMKLGYRIRRPCWTYLPWISWDQVIFVKLTREDLIAEDWEVIIRGIVGEFPITYQD